MLDLAELIYFQIRLITPYWIAGLITGALLSAFFKGALSSMARFLRKMKVPLFGAVLASFLGAFSPVTLHAAVPVILVAARMNVPEDILISFMIASVLINPNIVIFSLVLGGEIAALRLGLSILAGTLGGFLAKHLFKHETLFRADILEKENPAAGTGSSGRKIFFCTLYRSFRKTAPYLLLGFILTALFEKYVSLEVLKFLFLGNRALGVLFASSMGVPFYYCGGGTIPLINAWLNAGMSTGAAMAFMLTGPGTKPNNLSALKIILPPRIFVYYLIYIMLFGTLTGWIVNLIVP